MLNNRKWPYSGPFPVGTAGFPVARKVTLEDLAVAQARAPAASAGRLMLLATAAAVALWRRGV